MLSFQRPLRILHFLCPPLSPTPQTLLQPPATTTTPLKMLVANGGSDPAQDAFNAKSSAANTKASYASVLSPPPTATDTSGGLDQQQLIDGTRDDDSLLLQPLLSPPTPTTDTLFAGASTQQQPATASSTTGLFGSERIVDIIRREQHNQMQQQRVKGSPYGAQRKSGAVPCASADAAKIYCKEDGLFIDEQELLSISDFPIAPEQLVEMAKDVLRAGVHKCGKLSDDFQFSAPFIGPLTAQGFAKTMKTLALDDVFPDMSPRIYHLRVDPLQPNRVWFTTRPVGTNTGYLTAKLPIPVPPTYKVVELPPQTSSLSFNEQGEVIDFTMGYVMDRRIGNSGGLGGAFGFLWALDVPFPYPEGKPWSASWQQRLFNSGLPVVGPLLQMAMFVYDRVTNALLPSFLTAAHSRSMP